MHNIKYTILTIFKCTVSVALNTFTLYNHHHHPSPEPVSSSQTETLSPLNKSYWGSPQTPGNHHSAFCSVDLVVLRISHK